MKIFVTGQCTLHWGRMEYGNIGNYYIVEPFFRELHRVFPEAEITTTLQMTQEFCGREHICVLPMELYYSWSDSDLDVALKELAIAQIYAITHEIVTETPYIKAVIDSDLYIDFSGDMWGDNADLAGSGRFIIGLIKNRVAQLLGKPTAMLAGSPGPFDKTKLIDFAKEVYANFDLVTNRENISTLLMKQQGFDVSNTIDLACPSFLFEAARNEITDKKTPIFLKSTLDDKPVIGFMICGWNFAKPPFNAQYRDDSEFNNFVKVVEFLVNDLGATTVFMSHSNGFKVWPEDFELIKGRDYYIVKQLYSCLSPKTKKSVVLIDNIFLPAETKAIIKQFDMLVSGRVHGAVAALSQSIPTVIIDYGHEPKAHKLIGFANLMGMNDYICDPCYVEDMKIKIKSAWNNRAEIETTLQQRNIEVARLSRQNFDALKQITKENRNTPVYKKRIEHL